MKKCPNCSQFFTDDNMFCLDDGTSLLYVSETGQDPPVFPVSGDQPTVFVPKIQTPAVFTPPATAAVQSGSAMRWILPVLGFLLGVICVLGFLVFYMKFSPSNANNTSAASANSAAETNKESSTPSTPNAKPAERKEPTPAPSKSAPPEMNAPVLSRMNFRRGEITHNETGRIAARGERVFLLRCRRGQTLSASVSSDNNCVGFDNNSSSVYYVTTAGDNRITLKNSCESTAFNVSVTIR